jgi:hypothetical protein
MQDSRDMNAPDRAGGAWSQPPAAAPAPRTLRALNLVAAATTLASGLAVLGSNLVDPVYRAHYRDALWFVLAYLAFYAAVIYAFASPGRARLARRLAVAKALGAGLFLIAFPSVGQTWMAWTPGRYVYQLFDWGADARVVLMAFVFLGRGVWNTANVFALTRDVWMPLRVRRPLLGRLMTMVPVAIIVTCVWMFLALARMNAKEFSAEAHEVASLVLQDVGCDDLRAKAGTTTNDVRQRGDRRYDVTISWSCTDLVVIVRAPDGRFGTARDSRPECCDTPS